MGQLHDTRVKLRMLLSNETTGVLRTTRLAFYGVRSLHLPSQQPISLPLFSAHHMASEGYSQQRINLIISFRRSCRILSWEMDVQWSRRAWD